MDSTNTNEEEVMIIDNLTNPGGQPVNGDLIRYTYSNGSIVEKVYMHIEKDSQTVSNEPLSKLQWLQLFTFDEQIAIKIAKKTDITLEVYCDMLEASTTIDIDSQLATTTISYLESQAIITAERRLQIENIEYQIGV